VSRWFRHYAGMMRDEKLVRAALRARQPIERVVWVWGAILESASEIDEGGRYEIDIGEISYFLRVDESDLVAIADALEHLGRVCEGVVVQWGQRQFQSDRSADRQQRYRDRRKSRDANSDSEERSAASRDVALTSPSRHGDAPETETETETETEKKITARERADSPSDDFPRDGFDVWYAEYPRHEGKEAARKAFERVRRKRQATFARLMAGAKRYRAFAATVERQFVKMPATWLNAGCWDDEDAKAPSPESLPDNLIHIQRDSPDWPKYAAVWRQQRGKDPPVDKRGGWAFPRVEFREAAE